MTLVQRSRGNGVLVQRQPRPQIVVQRREAVVGIERVGMQGPPGTTGPAGQTGAAGGGGSNFASPIEFTINVLQDTVISLSPAMNVATGMALLYINGLLQSRSAYQISIDGTTVTVPAELLWLGAAISFLYSY